MQTIGDRIILLLKESGKKQKDLAELLSITGASVSNMCSGKTTPSNQNMALICKTFGVNREWLETGEGEMYRPTSQHEQLAAFFGSLLDGSVENETKLRLMTCLSKLSPDEWELLYKIAKEWTQDETEGQT